MARTRIALLFVALLFPAQLLAATFADALVLCKNREYAAAAAILDPLASRGDPHAQTWLAWLYDAGAGVQRDPARAASLYGSAARKGVLLAQTSLAMKYWTGDGVEKDFRRGQEWMLRAAANAERPADISPAELSAAGYRAPMMVREWYGAARMSQKKHHSKRWVRPVTRVAQY
jgi:TPR repeat protein